MEVVMKRLILIGDTMGVGKTATSSLLKYQLDNCVFLDGDWCWDMHPFIVDEETKTMVMNNIVYQLNQFIHCSKIENIIFCWVMHQQSIIDELLSRLDVSNCEVYPISLICSKEALEKHIQKDIDLGIRKADVLKRSVERLSMYDDLNTIKVDITHLTIEQTVEKICDIIHA